MSEFDDDVFHVDHISGRIYLDKEIDADSLPSNIFLLRVNKLYNVILPCYCDAFSSSERMLCGRGTETCVISKAGGINELLLVFMRFHLT